MKIYSVTVMYVENLHTFTLFSGMRLVGAILKIEIKHITHTK